MRFDALSFKNTFFTALNYDERKKARNINYTGIISTRAEPFFFLSICQIVTDFIKDSR